MIPQQTSSAGDQFDVCVLGSFMKDLVTQAPRRPRPGETIRGRAFDEYLGGKGFNQAVAATRAGARTAMIGRVGDDRHGAEFLAMLADEGVDSAYVRRDAGWGTGVGLPVVEPDGSNSIIVVPRANDAVTADDVLSAAPVIQRSRVLLVQLEVPMPAVLTALHLARSAGVLTVLNPAPSAPLPEDIGALVDVVVPNEVEAESLTGLLCHGDAVLGTAPTLRRRLARRGAIVTLGGRGVVVVDRRDGDEVPPDAVDEYAGWRTSVLNPIAVDTIDTVGAGDAFCGALAARIAAGDDLLSAAEYANAAGALATTRRGTAPAMPRADEIDALLTRTTVSGATVGERAL
ncbi:MAG: ribokinase [Hamadaea sp.]|uniref:ribokinase n=1 Tax=Hamadaea sp. TaxID=2024425 RepID=UPI00182248D5|nr:ribokinase [Hamadaea sp.]NUT18558.1 ribokinase [Hamadaea sp.]